MVVGEGGLRRRACQNVWIYEEHREAELATKSLILGNILVPAEKYARE